MNRNDLRFQVTGSKAAAASVQRMDEHVTEMARYRTEADRLEQELQQSGTVELRSYEGTGGVKSFNYAVVGFDVEKLNRLNYCWSRITAHKAQIEDFDRWQRAFGMNPEGTFELSPEDIQYFGL